LSLNGRRRVRTILGFSLTAVFWLSLSCVIAVVDSRNPEGPSVSLGRAAKSFPFRSGGSLSLENSFGNIQIEGWEREEIEIMVEEELEFPSSPRFYFLGGERSTPKIWAEGDEEELTIQIPGPGKKSEGSRFHCRLRVPQSVVLREIRTSVGEIRISGVYGSAGIRGDEGYIVVRNFSGPLLISLGRGDVEAEILDLRPEDEVHIEVGEGDIALFLEPAVAAEIAVETPAGRVIEDFEGIPPFEPPSLRAKLGEGEGAKVVLVARSGNIRIQKIEDLP